MSGKKTAAKAEKKETAVERFKRSRRFADRQVKWIMYHPEAKIIRVNVAEGDRGHDVDIPIDEADDETLAALNDALNWAAEDLGADPYEDPEEE